MSCVSGFASTSYDVVSSSDLGTWYRYTVGKSRHKLVKILCSMLTKLVLSAYIGTLLHVLGLVGCIVKCAMTLTKLFARS